MEDGKYDAAQLTVLKGLEAVAGNDLAFWRQVQLTAYEGRQAELLLAACEKVHQLAPEPVNASNYAAALLMMRERPADAVQLTLQVVNRAPQSRIARLFLKTRYIGVHPFPLALFDFADLSDDVQPPERSKAVSCMCLQNLDLV